MLESVPPMEGTHATLRPLAPDDAAALFEATPPDTFRLFLSWPSEWTLPAFRMWLAAKLFGPRQRAMVVIEKSSGAIVGCSSFLDIDPVNRAVEIGSTWYAPRVRGSAINPECKLLMLAHAFEREGCVRVTLKTDARNEHSKRAIAKLGATFEGVLRKHRIQQNGFARDTAYFGVTLEQWPEMKQRLVARVAAW